MATSDSFLHGKIAKNSTNMDEMSSDADCVGSDTINKPSGGSRWQEPIKSMRMAFKYDRRGAEFKKLITGLFEAGLNPYETALNLIEDSLQPNVNTMSLAVLKEFSSWIRLEKREEKYRDSLTPDIQMRAFSMVMKCNAKASDRDTVLLKTVVDVFNLRDVAESFIDPVRDMSARGLFPEAAEFASVLGIQGSFRLDEILIPCILQGKVNLSKPIRVPYLENMEKLQLELIRILDDLCLPKADRSRFLQPYQKRGLDIRSDISPFKSVKPLIKNLRKLYNIPLETTPNFARAHNHGTLVNLLSSYENKTMTSDNFDDMVRQGIETYPYLKEELFKLLCSKKKFYEAAKWAGIFGIPTSKLPQELRNYINNNPQASFPQNTVEENLTNRNYVNDGHLSLPWTSIDMVIMVKDEQQLIQAIQEIEVADIVGLDTEWLPMFGPPIEKADLLQVATDNKAFLIDILTLKNSMHKDDMKDCMHKLFCRDTPRKLGFDFGGDMKRMSDTLPGCGDEFENIANTVDLQELMKLLLQENIDFVAGMPDLRFLPNEYNKTIDDTCKIRNGDDACKIKTAVVSAKIEFSLTDLCYYFLGLSLDDSETCSNWSQRPLRWYQMRYAALDAHCLLPLFKQLRQRALDLKIDFDKIVSALVTGNKGVAVGHEKKSTFVLVKQLQQTELLDLLSSNSLMKNSSDFEVYRFRRVSDVHVLADSMLQTLGQHLRQCGIDCKFKETREYDFEIVKNEQRILLTTDYKLTSEVANSRLPLELICFVPTLSRSVTSKQQLVWFLKKMQIRVTEEDIFSRCILCNCSDFIFMNSPLLRIIYDSVILPEDLLSMQPFDRKIAYEAISTYVETTARKGQQERLELESLNMKNVSPQPPFGQDAEKWIFEFDGGKVNLLTGLIVSQSGQVHVQIETITSENAFDKIPLFYICHGCGRIYWNGTHTNRRVKGLQDIVEFDQSDASEKEEDPPSE